MALSIMSSIFTFLSSPVHTTLYPYAWATTLHAARISVAYQQNVRRSNSKLGWKTYLAGYLAMSWGGMLFSHFLLGLPPPIIYTVHPYVNYLSVHLVLTFLFSLYPEALNSTVLGNALFPLDGILRTNAVTSSLSHLSSPGIDAKLVGSPFFHLLLGAAAASGGGILAGTLGTWTPHWSVSTPVFLKDEVGIWGLLDVWGGALVALTYSVMSGQPAFGFLHAEGEKARMSVLEAKALAGWVLVGLFGMRVWVATLKPVKPVEKEKKTQ